MLIANIFGITMFLFLMWYKLKEDYHFEKIFNLSFLLLFSILLSVILNHYFFGFYWFWITVALISVTFVFSITRLKMNIYESLNALVVAILAYFAFYLLSLSISNLSLIYFIGFWLVLMLIFLYFFFEASYRRFAWYKSGRVGFSGLLVLGLFFVIRSVISYFFPQSPSLIGFSDIYISAPFALLFFLILFRLARNVN